jgi:pimeloyl-ACP methyl ester carboxylesterase
MSSHVIANPAPVQARLSDTPLPSPADVTGMWPGHFVNVAGIDLHVRVTPSANPVAEPALFVHGLGGSAHNWTDFAGVLRDQLAIESIDLPGFGRSGAAHDRNYSPRAQARVVCAYLDASGRGPVHLVGNSMGGAISILVASMRPDLVRTLTLISPAVPDVKVRAHPLRSDPRMALLVVPGIGGMALRRMRAIDVAARVTGTIAMCFVDPSRYPKARFDEAVAEGQARRRLPWAEDAMLRATRGLVRSQFTQRSAAWSAMRSITAPTLVLWGAADKLVAPDLAPVVAAAIGGARLLVLDDVGHTAMMEDPTTAARAMLALVEDSRA